MKNVSEQYGPDYYETFLYLPLNDEEWMATKSEYYQKCHRPAGATQPYAYGLGGESAVYRAAVCPKDWQAFEVGMGSRRESTWSTALCCKRLVFEIIALLIVSYAKRNEHAPSADKCYSGDMVTTDIWHIGYDKVNYGATTNKACARVIDATNDRAPGGLFATRLEFRTQRIVNETAFTLTDTYTFYSRTRFSGDQTTSINTRTRTFIKYHYDTEDITSTVYFTGGRALYPAWSMEWVAEDNASLDPPWPTLTSDMLIPTWSPNMSFDEGQYDNKGEGPDDTREQTKLGEIGGPIVGALAGLIGLLLILGVAFWCLRRRRTRKNEIKRQNFLHELQPRAGEDGTERRRSGSLTLNPPE